MEKGNLGSYIKKEVPIWLVTILGAYIITGLLLLLLSFVVYQFGIGEKVVDICIIAVYALVNFFAGFFVGKKKKIKKFLAGLIAGVAYFLILVLVSLICNGGLQDFAGNFFTTLMICAGAGTLGGMLS